MFEKNYLMLTQKLANLINLLFVRRKHLEKYLCESTIYSPTKLHYQQMILTRVLHSRSVTLNNTFYKSTPITDYNTDE